MSTETQHQIADFRLLVLPPIVPFPVWCTNSAWGWFGETCSVYAFMMLANPAGSVGPFDPCEYEACTAGCESTNWNCWSLLTAGEREAPWCECCEGEGGNARSGRPLNSSWCPCPSFSML